MELIQEIQTDAWWEDVTVPLLERARRRLRVLVRLIEKTQRQPIYTDFEDELGPETLVEIPNFGSGNEFDRFRAKARQFLLAHQDHLTIHKLRFNQPLTATDLDELERILLESGIGTFEHLQSLSSSREYLVTRYDPDSPPTSELNRLAATLEEVARKTAGRVRLAAE
jgi:type I restriction enzyme R subunit